MTVRSLSAATGKPYYPFTTVDGAVSHFEEIIRNMRLEHETQRVEMVTKMLELATKYSDLAERFVAENNNRS